MNKWQLIQQAPAELREELKRYVEDGDYKSVSDMILWGMRWASTQQGSMFWNDWHTVIKKREHNG